MYPGSLAPPLNRPWCCRAGCGRRAYLATAVGFLCYVCDADDRIQYAIRLLRGPPGRPTTTPIQDFMDVELLGGPPGRIAAMPPLARLTLEFVHGDGWRCQCPCGRCERPWLNQGWICPAEYHRLTYVRLLGTMFYMASYRPPQLAYVDYDEAVLRFHEMYVDLVPWDEAVLREIAESSARQVRLVGAGVLGGGF